MKGYIKINNEFCKECHLCIYACPKGCIVPTEEYNSRGYHPVAVASGKECTGCTFCAVMCPEVAIEVYRE